MANCPRCREVLVANQVDEFELRVCVPCKGMLSPHADIVKILDRSWHAVTREAAEKMEFYAKSSIQTETVVRCPDCQQPMEKYGYMGLAAIPIDRCDACALLWLDTDELQNMVLALAKSNYRSEQARQEEWHTDTEDFVSVGMVGTAAPGSESWLFGVRPSGAGMVVAEAVLRFWFR